MLNEEKLKVINIGIYQHIESILKRLNPRIHFRFYCIVIDKNDKPSNKFRMKKTISTTSGQKFEYVSDTLQTAAQVLRELGLADNEATNLTDLQELVHHSRNCYNEKLAVSDEDVKEEYNNHDTQLLYANTLLFTNTGKEEQRVIYLLGIRNIEKNISQIYYDKPSLSFLKMALDYFFLDFFAVSPITLSEQNPLQRKYQEDEVQFLRRIGRLFFGKMQDILSSNEFNFMEHKLLPELKNEYYINNLLEKIDDISTKTYEGESPFGTILFIDKDLLEINPTPINFAIRFTSDDLISLEDSKRIRKLLELTNTDKHLYLISDCKYIYGLAEVQWNFLKGSFAFRADFKGLSKYNLVFINIGPTIITDGRLVYEKEQNFYRSNHDIKVTSEVLVSISFKNPKLNEEGYTSERMTSILKQQFLDGDIASISNDAAEYLEKIIRMSREQKHGTIVVITDPTTADEELKKLRRQSTLIEPMRVETSHIKFLTAIDGAIYFDTEGECRAIGVILDGIAQKRQGDSSRGARYNSAYRYHSKLKLQERKSVIVIISEDGMIDIIPTLDDEEEVSNLIEEIIDFLDEEHKEFDIKLEEKERELAKLHTTDFHLLFNLARKFTTMDKLDFKKKYEKARVYYDKAFSSSRDSFIPANYHNSNGNCYYVLEEYDEAEKCYNTAIQLDKQDAIYHANAAEAIRMKIKLIDDKESRNELLRKSLSHYQSAIKLSNESSYNTHIARWHNRRGVVYSSIISTSSNDEEILKMRTEQIHEYSEAIKFDPKKVYYKNRAGCYKKLNKMLESAKDYIEAYLIEQEKELLDVIKEIVQNNIGINMDIIEFYSKLIQKKLDVSDELHTFILGLDASVEVGYTEAAPTKE